MKIYFVDHRTVSVRFDHESKEKVLPNELSPKEMEDLFSAEGMITSDPKPYLELEKKLEERKTEK